MNTISPTPVSPSHPPPNLHTKHQYSIASSLWEHYQSKALGWPTYRTGPVLFACWEEANFVTPDTQCWTFCHINGNFPPLPHLFLYYIQFEVSLSLS